MGTKKAAVKKSGPKKSTKSAATKKWSAKVTKHSNALDLEKSVFKKKTPKEIAESLKRSAEQAREKRVALFNPLCQC